MVAGALYFSDVAVLFIISLLFFAAAFVIVERYPLVDSPVEAVHCSLFVVVIALGELIDVPCFDVRYVRSARIAGVVAVVKRYPCLLYTSPSPRDPTKSRMPSSA